MAHPQVQLADALKGIILEKLGSGEKTVEDFAQAIEADVDHAKVVVELALWHLPLSVAVLSAWGLEVNVQATVSEARTPPANGKASR